MSFPIDFNYWAKNIFKSKMGDFNTYFYLYRYVDEKEYEFIKSKQMVFSINPYGTYWTTLLTDDPMIAKCRLMLNREPKYRIGGIPRTLIDPILINYIGSVKPNNSYVISECKNKNIHIGGALEIVLNAPIMITSLYDLQHNKFISFI